MTTTTKGTTMTTPESPGVPVFAPHSPATGAQVPTEPENGAGAQSERDSWVDWEDDPDDTPASHTLAAFVLRVTADNVRMDRVRCDGCAWYFNAGDGSEYGPGQCTLAAGDDTGPDHDDPPMWADGNDGYSSWLNVKPDHACNAWTPKAGQ